MKLAVDASVLVAESLRIRGVLLITHVDLELIIAEPTWSEVVHEIGRRIDSMAQHGRFGPSDRDRVLAATLAMLSQSVKIIEAAEYGSLEAEARDRIPQDRNDWPTVALALAMDVPIWTQDRDLFGCGVPVWTTQTLLTHVEAGRARTNP